METIKINVGDYYGVPSYYSVMPESIFIALEAAFLNGEKTAIVSAVEFRIMCESYISKMA